MTVELVQAMVKIPVMLEHSLSWLRPTVMFLLCCLYVSVAEIASVYVLIRIQVLGHEISYSNVALRSEEGFFFRCQRVMMMLPTIYMMFYDCR